MDQDESAVRAAIEESATRLLDAVNASDVEAVAAAWDEDGILLPPHHARVVGRDAIRTYFTRLFEASRLTFQFTSSKIWMADRVAWQLLDYSAEIVPIIGGPSQRDRGKGVHVFRRQLDGVWLLSLDIWNSDQPVGVPYSGGSIQITALPDVFAVNRDAPDRSLPALAGARTFLSMTRTSEELSIVAPETVVLDGFVREPGWRCLKVGGPLPFDQIGILASLASCLAAADISIFAVSTYDTDYLLVREEALPRAMGALEAGGYRVRATGR